MYAQIQLADDESYVRLLHGFLATHNSYSHDADQITFADDAGMSLHVNLKVNYVSFGNSDEPESLRYWTENISVGDIQGLLRCFIRSDYATLRLFHWLGPIGKVEGTR
ncbi:hypothetical protein BH10PLA1_BH10PLA1_07540 [soil metagenome]